MNILENKRHVKYLKGFKQVIENKGEKATTERLARFLQEHFPEYRDLSLESLEIEVTRIIYSD